MFPWSQFLTDAALFIVAFTVLIGGSILLKPRLWLHDFPADIRALAAPKTEAEKRQTRWLALAMLPVMFVLPVVLGRNVRVAVGPDFDFWMAWVYGFGLFFLMNLWDLLVMDFIGLSLIDPQHPPFPGTEGAAGWRNYRFHFYGFLKGTVMGVVFAVVFAALVSVLP